MTTNKPEVKRYDCTNGGAEYCYGCYTMKEDELGYYVEWEAYEALQAAHEEELFQVRQDRDTHFGELMRAIEQVDAMKAECEKLRAAIRRLCNIYVIDDYYTGKQREEMLERAVERSIDAAMEGENP